MTAAHDHAIAIIQAHAEGKVIEVAPTQWPVEFKAVRDVDELLIILGHESNYEVRIKPEPLECWVNVYSDGCYPYLSEDRARIMADSLTARIAVHMREVLP